MRSRECSEWVCGVRDAGIDQFVWSGRAHKTRGLAAGADGVRRRQMREGDDVELVTSTQTLSHTHTHTGIYYRCAHCECTAALCGSIALHAHVTPIDVMSR